MVRAEFTSLKKHSSHPCPYTMSANSSMSSDFCLAVIEALAVVRK